MGVFVYRGSIGTILSSSSMLPYKLNCSNLMCKHGCSICAWRSVLLIFLSGCIYITFMHLWSINTPYVDQHNSTFFYFIVLINFHTIIFYLVCVACGDLGGCICKIQLGLSTMINFHVVIVSLIELHTCTWWFWRTYLNNNNLADLWFFWATSAWYDGSVPIVRSLSCQISPLPNHHISWLIYDFFSD